MASPFDVLAEPNRRAILDLLQAGERPVSDLVEQLRISQPLVSKHLRILRDAGLVDVRIDAQRRFYRLRPGPLVEIDAWIQPYRRFLHSRFDLLERQLDEMPDEQSPNPGDESE